MAGGERQSKQAAASSKALLTWMPEQPLPAPSPPRLLCIPVPFRPRGEKLFRTWMHTGRMASLAMVKGQEPELWLSSSIICSLPTLGKSLSLSFRISKADSEE